MTSVFRKQIKDMMERDIQVILDALAAARKRERNMKVFKSQTDALLQVLSEERPARTPITWSTMGVDAQSQTDGQSSGTFYSKEMLMEMELGTEGHEGDSPVYCTLEMVLNEMKNKGIINVLLSDWLVYLLAIIRRKNPTSLCLSNYYYKNEAKAAGTPLHMLRVDAGVRFMSAVDNMCSYSSAGIGKGLFSDSELLVHYAVANASCLNDSEVSYIQFCVDPLSYTLQQLTKVVSLTILDIVDFVKTTQLPFQDTVYVANVKNFPPSYINVVNAVNGLLRGGGKVVKNSALVQFLPLTTSSAHAKTDMSAKEKVLLGIIVRTALMWYVAYMLSSAVQNDSTTTYGALLRRCMVRDGIVMQSLQNAGKAPYLSTGMLLPGLFAYIFYVSKEAGETQVLGSLSLSAPFMPKVNQSLESRLKSWGSANFCVRDKIAQFIVGDSVLKSSKTPRVAAFPGTSRDRLQGEIDSALVVFLQELIMHSSTYRMPRMKAVDFLKETTSTSGYLQVSQETKQVDYKMTRDDNMTHTAMTGFLKNPFLYKEHNTMNFDTFGRETIPTTRATMVSTPVISQ